MRSFEIIVQTKDGTTVFINEGQTYIDDDGQEITYEQMLEWLLEGSLRQHGFIGYTGFVREHSDSNNSYANHLAKMRMLLAAM